MKLLIAGGFGYIGGRLGQHLIQTGHQIILGSRQAGSASDWLPQAEAAQVDWNDQCSLEQICAGVDIVVQAAGMNAQDCAADPVTALEFNGVATARLLQAASKQRVRRFIYLSTAHVYGAPLVGMISENICPANLHPYATSHRAGEDVVRAAHQQGRIEGIVIRLSNAFGVPAHKDANCWMLLVNDLCRQAVVNRCLVMHSSGKQRRDFVTLHDAVRAVSHLLHLPKEQIGDGLFNVGGEWAPRVIDMVELIQHRCSEVLGFEPGVHSPEVSSGESDFVLEYRIDKLLSTGFSLERNIDEEIDATLLFCQRMFKK